MATAQMEGRLQEGLNRLHDKIIDYLQDAHAMESNILRMLDSMIATTNDAETLHQLKRHRMDTERHERMVRERLEALGHRVALSEDVPAIMAAWLKGLGDRVRSDKPGKNARDGFVAEHLEIAAYSLLEHLALSAGDIETARMARFIREDEEQMARWIAARWTRFIDLTLSEAGIQVPHRSTAEGRWSANRLQGRWGGRRMAMREPTTSFLQYLGWTAGLGVAGYLLYELIGSRSRTGYYGQTCSVGRPSG